MNTRRKSFSRFTEQEEDIFCEAFYDCWKKAFPDEETDIMLGSSRPWGRPWFWTKELAPSGSMEESAKKFFEMHRGEIADLLAEDALNREELEEEENEYIDDGDRG